MSAKGEIVLPKAVRTRMRISEGVRLNVRIRQGEIVLSKAPEHDWRQWEGRFEKSRLLHALANECQRELKRDRQRA
jgi:AbrB family looped-hinge helix DNA binding protein